MTDRTKLVATALAAALTLAPAAVLAEAFEAVPLPAAALSAQADEARPVKGPHLPEAQGPAAPDLAYPLGLRPEPTLVVGYEGSIPRLQEPQLLDHGAPEVRLRPAGPALRLH